jgi:signal transduction histidine kinase/ActR/RegA family two-component response regulator
VQLISDSFSLGKQQEMSVGRKRALMLVGLAAALALSGWLLILGDELPDTPFWTAALYPFFDFAAGLKCFQVARAQKGSDRKAWLNFAIACFCFGIGDIIWGIYEVAYGIHVPTPCLADLAYLAFPFFAVAGMWHYRNAKGPTAAASLVQIGNMGIIFSAIVLGYVFLFQGLLVTAESVGAALAQILYGIENMGALCFGLIAVSLHVSGRRRKVLSLIVCGITCVAATFFTFVHALLDNSYDGTDPVNLLYLIAFAFFYWAAFEHQQFSADEPLGYSTAKTQDRAQRLETLLPALSVSGVLLTALLFRDALNESSIPYITVSALLFVISLALRNWWGHNLETRLRSEAVASQMQLEDANRELREEMKTRAQIQEELRQSQKMEALGQLTGGVAHDFNNLLAVILSNLEMAAEESADNKANLGELLQDATDAAQRGASLTQRLLALSRKQSLSPETLDVNELLAGMQSLLERTLGEKIRVRIEGEENTWPCAVDRAQLENVVLNLAINARDAMPHGGDLTIETSNVEFDEGDAVVHPDLSHGCYAVIAVRDSGEGMSPAVLAKAFEPFYTTKGTGEGTGLGLSMVYGFAKQSGGHAAIESQPEAGTVVRLYFPRSEKSIPAQAQEKEQPLNPQGKGESVLVVEDEPAVRKLVISILENLGYQVVSASDGVEALSRIATLDSLDLLLSDVVLPGGVSGRELARCIAEHRPEVSILLMSGYATEVLLKEGDLAPGTELLHKPFHIAELARKVREALDKNDHGASHPPTS